MTAPFLNFPLSEKMSAESQCRQMWLDSFSDNGNNDELRIHHKIMRPERTDPKNHTSGLTLHSSMGWG